MSAALVLAQSGFQVDVIERSRYLGGRATSVMNQRLGIEIDRGQHVLLRCCTNLLDFYARIGASQCITYPNYITFARQGKTSSLRPVSLPEPLHLLPSLIRFRQLGILDKARTLGLFSHSLSPEESDTAAGTWISMTGQSKEALKSFWEPVLIGALNETLDRASARYASMVIRQAMMINRDGLQLGVPNVILGDLHGEHTRRAIRSLGGRIHLQEQVSRIVFRNNRAVAVQLANGTTLLGGYFVVAAGLSQQELVPSTAITTDSGAQAMLSPEQVPIVTLNLWYRRQFQYPQALCIAGNHFHWCFNRSDFRPQLPGMLTALSLVASAARGLSKLPNETICKTGVEELGLALNDLVPYPDNWSVIKCQNATFSPAVGCDSMRPSQRTSFRNVFIAGDWTDTGWPGTMESAVRSGYICAKHILEQEGKICPLPLSDLPPKGLAACWMRR